MKRHLPAPRRHARLVLPLAALAFCLGAFPSARSQTAVQGPIQTQSLPGQGRPGGPPAPAPVGNGLILGQVVDAAGGAVSSAIVTISGISMAAPFTPRRILTNAEGRFLFTALAKGSYSIDVAKNGYANSGPGKVRPDGSTQPIELAEGERNGNVKITMWKYAAISGVLTDDAGEPFVGATVWSLRRSYSTGRSQMNDGPSASTDDRGYFRVANLLPGDYMICVVASQTTLPAALVEAYGQARGSAATDMQRSMSVSALGFQAGTSTPGIRMGDFVVQTVGPYSRGMVPPGPDEGGRLMSFQTTFYPGVVNMSQADVITLASGEDRTGADIRLRLVPVAPVSGTVMGPNGPLANIGVRLAPDYSPELGNELSFEAALTVSDQNGRFMFMGVPAGQYVLRALKVPQPAPYPMIGDVRDARGGPPAIPQEPTLWANVPIAVGPDGIPDLTVKVSSGFRLAGKIIFEGTTAKPPAPNVLLNSTVQISPADGHQIGYMGALRGRVETDSAFATYEVPPGRYIVRYSGGAPGWTLKSVMYQGRDVSSVPLDVHGDISGLQIVMTDKPTDLSGTVRDDSGKIDPKAAVILFPADREQWTAFGDTPRRLRMLRTNAAGGFRLTGLPAGQYLIAAIPDGQAGEWQNPATLELISRNAVPIAITDAEKKTQDLVSRRIR